MTLVSPAQSNANDTIEAADINTPVNQLAAVINGNIENDNIKANAGIDASKLADGTLATAKLADGAVTPAKMLGIDMFAVGSTIAGTSPAAGTGQFYIQAGTSVGTFSSNALDVVFPTAFPNGLLTVVIVDGDSSTGVAKSIGHSSTSKTGFRAQSPNNGVQRINWIAIGF